MRVKTPPGFRLASTIYSHGWCSLPPFTVEKKLSLRFSFTLPSGGVAQTTISQKSSEISVVTGSAQPLSPTERALVGKTVRSCLRLDEDFSGFYAVAARHPRFRWVKKRGCGRMLRSPSVFEDLVKMICTTNCSWELTQAMVKNLCSKLGGQTFPQPAAIADCTEKFLRKEIRSGYRSPYILELARRVATGSLQPELWRSSTLPTGELFEEVSSIKGVGPYAAGNVLKLLGRYDYLGIDSWCRKRFSEIYKNGRKVSDKTIERFYEPFGSWRGLFFWMDLTKTWYDEKVPF